MNWLRFAPSSVKMPYRILFEQVLSMASELAVVMSKSIPSMFTLETELSERINPAVLLIVLPLVQIPLAAPPLIVHPVTMQGVPQPAKTITSEFTTRVALSPKSFKVMLSIMTREQLAKESPGRAVVFPPRIIPPERQMWVLEVAVKAVIPVLRLIVPSRMIEV